MDKHRLIVDSVVVRFGEKTVLSGGYITSETGMVTGLLGRNGAGKSCMFRALMGGLRVENVMVSIDEKPVNRQVIGRSIKYLPQGRLIPDGMTLHRAFDLYGVNYWTFVNRFPKYSRHYDSPVYELSGGQARLAELYMVLHSDAPFYILDEPFSQVDPVSIEAVQAIIRERAKDHGIIITDHNYPAISTVADNLFVIADGYTNQVHSREDLVRHGYLRAEGHFIRTGRGETKNY
ncbi:MAG: ATP-binding cassette domain-containing protein [Bacteroidales bacterium]|nr:ATP-binding cassette domain-containing protein [Bacteroidales bacterium]